MLGPRNYVTTVVVCGNISGKMCGKIEKLSDWNKNGCGSRYGHRDNDSGDKKTKRQKCKKTKGKKAKILIDKMTKKNIYTKKTKAEGPKGPHALRRS